MDVDAGNKVIKERNPTFLTGFRVPFWEVKLKLYREVVRIREI